MASGTLDVTGTCEMLGALWRLFMCIICNSTMHNLCRGEHSFHDAYDSTENDTYVPLDVKDIDSRADHYFTTDHCGPQGSFQRVRRNYPRPECRHTIGGGLVLESSVVPESGLILVYHRNVS